MAVKYPTIFLFQRTSHNCNHIIATPERYVCLLQIFFEPQGYFPSETWQITFKTPCRTVLSVKPHKEKSLISHVGKSGLGFLGRVLTRYRNIIVEWSKGSREKDQTCKRSKWIEKGKHRVPTVRGWQGKKEEQGGVVRGLGIEYETLRNPLSVPAWSTRRFRNSISDITCNERGRIFWKFPASLPRRVFFDEQIFRIVLDRNVKLIQLYSYKRL